MENEIKDNKNKSRIIAVLVIIFTIMVLVVIYCKEEVFLPNTQNIQEEFIEEEIDENLSYREKEKVREERFFDQKENIKINQIGLDVNKNIILEIQNNSNKALCYFDVYAIFYDGNQKPIDVLRKNINIIKQEGKYYCNIEKTPENFETVEFVVKKDYYDNYSIYNDIEFTHSENQNGMIEIKGKNIGAKEIEKIDFSILYKNENGKIIFVKNEADYHVKKDFNIECYAPYNDETYEKIEYASYEIILNGVILDAN